MATAQSVGSLFIDIEARTARLETDLGKARNLLNKLSKDTAVMSRGFASAFNVAKAAVAAFASVQAIKAVKDMTMSTLEQMRAQQQLADQTGLTVNDLKAYQEASENLGVTNLDLAKTMKELFSLQSDARAGNKAAAKQIEQMGYSVEQFAELKPNELFEGVVDKMSRIKDVSQRSALGMKVFGKESMNVTTLLSQGTKAIAEARSEMDRLGQTTSNYDTARVQVALAAVAELDDRWEVFKKHLAVGLTPLIYTASTRLADFLGSLDVESLAVKISHYVLQISGFIMTIPDRFSLMMKRVQLIWYNFISQFDTGDKDSLMARLFGTKAENQARTEELKAQIAQLEATIKSMSNSLDKEFAEKVDALMKKLKALPPMTVSVTKGISTGMKEMVDTFANGFSQIADLSDQFIDGEAVKFGDWLRTLVKMMVNTFLKVSLINPLMNMVFGSLLGGVAGGWWTNAPSMMGSSMAAGAAGGAVSDTMTYGGPLATGGPFMAGETHLVGENGPELATFSRSGYMTPTERLVNRSGDSSSGGNITIQQTFSSGLQRADLAAIVPAIIQQTKAAVADAVMRGGMYRKAVRGS